MAEPPTISFPLTGAGVNLYVSDLMRKQLALIGVKGAVEIQIWQEKAETLKPDEFLSEVREFKKQNPLFDSTPLENYLVASQMESTMQEKAPRYSVGDEIIAAILPTIEKMKGGGFSILKTDLTMSYEQTKIALKEIMKVYNENINITPDELILPFIISKEQTLSGQVISNLDSAKKSVTLITAFSVGGEFFYHFFGESKTYASRKLSPFMRFNSLFYVYKFQADSSEDIILLSQNELEITTCKINGMEANCYDFLKIGNMARINTTQKIFFVHSQEPSIDKIDETRFWELAKGYACKEAMNQAFFGKYPHPDWFAAFMISWTFSGKLDNMPTHLSLLSPPSQGKTRMLKNLGKVFTQEISDGGTIKGLVPSFANGVPREGYLVRCKRFAYIDEFIHLIQSSSRANIDFDSGSHYLLKVLEHSEGEFSSAFGIIKARPRMWCLFCSNVKPYEHIKNLVDLHEKLNVAFMSRILWYVFDEEHLQYINAHKGEVMTYKEAEEPVPSNELISMVDFLHSFTLNIPYSVVKDIHAKYRPFVPANLELDIYDSRMVMHIHRMLDGYAKYKSILEARKSFTCTTQDISEFEAIFGRIVRSWSMNLDESKLTPAMKLSYLNAAYREIFDFIKINQNSGVVKGVDEPALMRIKGVSGVDIAKSLVKKGILNTVYGGSANLYFTFDISV